MDERRRQYVIGQIAQLCTAYSIYRQGITGTSTNDQVHAYFEAKSTMEGTLDDIVRALRQDRRWASRFSLETVRDEVESIAAALAGRCSEELATQYLDLLIAAFDDYDIEHRVYIPLTGIALEVRSLRLGKCTILTTDESWLKRQKRRVNAFFRSPPEREREDSAWRRQFFKNFYTTVTLLSDVSSEYVANQDMELAQAAALAETQKSVELLRYSIPFLNSDAEARMVGIQGEHTPGSKVLTVISSNYQGWLQSSEERETFRLLNIRPEDVRTMHKVGIFTIGEMMAQPESEFEAMIIRAVHWFADSQVQREVENKFLSLIICFETFFTPEPGESISDAIAEGMVLLLSRELDQRLRLRQQMKRLYGLRSTVSHGRESPITTEDLDQLQGLAQRLIIEVVRQRKTFRTRQDVQSWILRQRLAPGRSKT